MPSSGYTAISFTAGEQPTTAKWNLVGSNDASFNTGNGFNDGIIIARHLATGAVTGSAISNYSTSRSNNGTTASEASALLQTGWVGFTFGGSGATTSIAVTFPVAFTNAPPIVITTSGGDQASGALAYGSGVSVVQGNIVTKAANITKTGFTIYIYGTTGGWTAGQSIYAQWLAVGA